MAKAGLLFDFLQRTGSVIAPWRRERVTAEMTSASASPHVPVQRLAVGQLQAQRSPHAHMVARIAASALSMVAA